MADERVLIISSDCHGGMRTSEYGAYLEAQYHDDLVGYLSEKSVMSGHVPAKRAGSSDREDRVRFTTDLESRLSSLEAEGIVGEVIFPDGTAENEIPFTGVFGGSGRHSFELKSAAMRANNRWLGEHCAPNRQIGLALIPLDDPEYAADEARKARGLGLLGINPSFNGADPNQQLHDRRFDPLWAACAENGLTVNFHTGAGLPTSFYDSPEGHNVFITEGFFWPRRTLAQMILGGILERFPELKVVFSEVHSDWMPDLLDLLDERWEKGGPTGSGRMGLEVISRELCPMKPSEYFRRQCSIGSSVLSRNELEQRHRLGVHTMMFGTDHAHSVATWKCTPQFLRMTFGAVQVPEDEARQMLGGNIVELYHLDADKLAPIVERVGPRISDVLTPPDDHIMEGVPEYLQPQLVGMADRDGNGPLG